MHSGREGGREGEHDGPCDTGSATAGCYVSAPPALASHRLSRLCFWPIPHPVATAHFFSPSTHMAPHMAASLPPLLLCSPTISSSPSPPPTCVPGEPPTSAVFAVTLSVFCLSAFPSLIIFISRFSHSLSHSLSLCCAVRLQLHALDYRDMTETGHQCTLRHTYTNISHILIAVGLLKHPLLLFQKAPVLQIGLDLIGARTTNHFQKKVRLPWQTKQKENCWKHGCIEKAVAINARRITRHSSNARIQLKALSAKQQCRMVRAHNTYRPRFSLGKSHFWGCFHIENSLINFTLIKLTSIDYTNFQSCSQTQMQTLLL